MDWLRQWIREGSLSINEARRQLGPAATNSGSSRWWPAINTSQPPIDFSAVERTVTSQGRAKKIEFDRRWMYWATCNKPANRNLAERAIFLMRRTAGISRVPPIYIWVDSPFQGRALCEFLHKRSKAWDLSSTPEPDAYQRAALRPRHDWQLNTWDNPVPQVCATLHGNIIESDMWGYHIPKTDRSSWDSRASAGRERFDFLSAGQANYSTSPFSKECEEEMWDLIFRSVSKDQIQKLTSSSLLAAHGGQLDTGNIVGGLRGRDIKDELKPSHYKDLQRWEALAKSCQYWWCYKNYVIISERFERVVLEETQSREILRPAAHPLEIAPVRIAFEAAQRVPRLHCTTGPAIRYRDGRSVYAIAGVRVPDIVVEAPQKITAEMIDKEINAEVRRHMIDRFRPEPSSEYHGAAAYIRETHAARISHDERYGTLWRREVLGDEPIVMLEVVNRSPEPEGHYKHYFLRVPPHMQTAHAASAWTFGMDPDDYEPVQET